MLDTAATPRTLDAARLGAYVKSLATAEGDPRLMEITERVMDVAFPLIEELKVTEEEWQQFLAFLNRVGEVGHFGILAWVLGYSQVVEWANTPLTPDATDRTILGPFFVPGAPHRPHGTPLFEADDGSEILFLGGSVRDTDGRPLEGLTIDVWSCDGKGAYSSFDPNQPPYNLRGKVTTDADGRYEIYTLLPANYAIPGPCGEMLPQIGRQVWRPAHVHLRIEAEGHAPLITQIYLGRDPFLKVDSAAGVVDSLTIDPVRHDDPEAMKGRGVERPFHEATFDIVMQPLGVAA